MRYTVNSGNSYNDRALIYIHFTYVEKKQQLHIVILSYGVYNLYHCKIWEKIFLLTDITLLEYYSILTLH
jgi:hypothetical protein